MVMGVQQRFSLRPSYITSTLVAGDDDDDDGDGDDDDKSSKTLKSPKECKKGVILVWAISRKLIEHLEEDTSMNQVSKALVRSMLAFKLPRVTRLRPLENIHLSELIQ